MSSPDARRATPAADVSRETTRRRRRRRLLALAAVGAATLVLVACTRAPAPQGWAPPQPVMANNQQLVIAARKAKLYALPPSVTTATWQFPPVDKNSYPVDSVSAAKLAAMVDALSIGADQKSSIQTKVKNLNIQGPSVSDLNNAINGSAASPDNKTKLTTAVDQITQADKTAIASPQAFYGDIGVSSDSKTVYAAAFRGYVYALESATGRLVWVQKLNDQMVGGVAVDGSTVYYGSKGKRLYAADATTGAIKWTFAAAGEIWSTPTIAAGTIYATSLDGTVYALDTAGKQRWTFKNANAGIAGAVTVAGDALYVGAFDNRLYSVKVSDGTENWAFVAGNWFWGAPRVQDGVVYAANLDGKVYAVDASKGSLRWARPFDSGSPIRSSPTMVGGGLIVANKAGKVYKLEPATGRPVGSAYNAGSTIYANLTGMPPDTVYVSPQSPTLIVLNASGNLTLASSYPLAQ
ncbi:MAG: PQQ-like beta-propeller repeat protein [Dehalococcoidia bacterium]|nr:PQQ-like beta-propeller repeat protein [Dehalococcoidia bacterium]